MSDSLPARPDARQIRIQAKELLQQLLVGEPEAVALAAQHDHLLLPASAKLTDAQRVLARKYGFSSWAKLIDEVETPKLIEDLRATIHSGDAEKLDSLLAKHAALRRKIKEPVFDFHSPAILPAASSKNAAKLISVLVKYGADPNQRSTWWAGGFSPLDYSKGEATAMLLELGAKFDVWSAAAQGRADVLASLLDADPSLIDAPGGDGKRPIHFASTLEVAELLICRGADLEIRDVDHESTPVQYQVKELNILGALVKAGATPDVFTAIALNDRSLLRSILEKDPEAAMSRVGVAPFKTEKSDGGHIYLYQLGVGKTPQELAVEKGFLGLLEELDPYTSPARKLIAAAWMQDESKIDELLKLFPDAGKKADVGESKAISAAAQHGPTETIRLLLKAGFDPSATGMDSGSALHVASWFGRLDAVQLLIPYIPMELRDAHHGATPLSWAVHGANWNNYSKGDYVGVVKALLEAGSDATDESVTRNVGKRSDLRAVLQEFQSK